MWVCTKCFFLNNNTAANCNGCGHEKTEPSALPNKDKNGQDIFFPLRKALQKRIDTMQAQSEASTSAVKKIHGTVTLTCPSSTALKVKWQPLDTETEIKSYQVKYRPFTEKRFKTKEADTEDVVITGLNEGTKYEVKVFRVDVDGNNHFMFQDFTNTPVSKTNFGQDVLVTGTTLQKQIPTKQFVHIVSPTSSAVIVKWETAVADEDIQSYEVKYRSKNDKQFKSLEIEIKEVRLSDLQPKTEYIIKVFWIDEQGENHFMFQEFVTTLKEESTCDQQSKTESDKTLKMKYSLCPTSRTVVVKWQKVEAAKDVQSYQVKYRPATEKRFLTIEVDTEEAEIKDLNEETKYEVKVFWVDEDGNGHFMFQDSATTTTLYTGLSANLTTEYDQMMSRNHSLCTTSSTLLVKWQKVETANDLQSYQVKYRPAKEKRFLTIEVDTEEAEIEDLKEETKYEVKVFWVDEDGNSNFIFQEFATTMTPDTGYCTNHKSECEQIRKRNYTLCPTSRTVSLKWHKLQTAKDLQSYQVKYRSVKEKRFHTIEVYSEEAEIIDLKEKTEYEVKVFWTDEDGNSLLMFHDFATTTVANVDASKAATILVKWQTLQAINDLQSYEVKYRSSKEKRFHTKEVDTTEAELNGLKEETEYEVKVFLIDNEGNSTFLFSDFITTLSSTTIISKETSDGAKSQLGKYVTIPTSTTLTVSWDAHAWGASGNRGVRLFQIKYRISKGGERFKCQESPCSIIKISNLKPCTKYELKVFWVDEGGENFPLFSDEATTTESKSTMLKKSKMSFIDNTRNPTIFHLEPVNTNVLKGHEGDSFDVRICDMVSCYEQQWNSNEEKTIMLLGATGTGKSTFIDALINYITEVAYSEDHRFALINQTEEEKYRATNKTWSQTSTINVYRIPKLEGLRVNCKVNIIDTPGFNDTRDSFDDNIKTQISNLFENYLEHLDAIFIVLPMSVHRLTTGQKNVFTNICELFDKDIDQNIFILFTFDDGGSIDGCMNVLTAAGMRYNSDKPYFRFNNSNIFSAFSTTEKPEKEFSVWETRTESFSKVFEVLSTIPRTTVKSSFEVMRNRSRLELQISGLEDDINRKAREAVRISDLKEKIQNHEKSMHENKNYIIDTEVVRYEQKYTGKNSINCPEHERTCHANCWVQFDWCIGQCEIFKDGKCTICECNKAIHKRGPYRYVEIREIRQVPNKEMVEAFNDAQTQIVDTKSTILKLEADYEKSIFELESKLKQMKDTFTLLKVSALMPPKHDSITGYIVNIINKVNRSSKEHMLLMKCLDQLEKNIPLSKVAFN